MKEVRWTKTAVITLRETSDYIQLHWDDKVNQAFLDQLEFRISQLQAYPELGTAIEGTEYRKLTIHKTVSLFYTNLPNFIKLLVIWDNRSNPDQLLKKLSESNLP